MCSIYIEKKDYNFSAKLLEHSLEENPEDIIITEDEFINEIKVNQCFKQRVNEYFVTVKFSIKDWK